MIHLDIAGLLILSTIYLSSGQSNCFSFAILLLLFILLFLLCTSVCPYLTLQPPLLLLHYTLYSI